MKTRMVQFAKHAAAPILAAVLVLGASVGPAASYFTTYVTAQGGYPLSLSQRRVVTHESVDANVKSVSVQNTGEQECYVRVRVAASDAVAVSYAGAGWMDGGDGYWYYAQPVQPGASTGVLAATIHLPTAGPERPIPEGTELNVVVLSECAPVLYDDLGNAKANGPAYEGWALRAKEAAQ